MVVALEKFAVVRALQEWKVLAPMLVTFAPLIILRLGYQPCVVEEPVMLVTLSGRVRAAIHFVPLLPLEKEKPVLLFVHDERSSATYLFTVANPFRSAVHPSVAESRLMFILSGTGALKELPPA
jgi:hypothetical protein